MSFEETIGNIVDGAERRREERSRNPHGRPAVGLKKVAIAMIVIIILLTCTVKVDPGYEGVVVNQLRGGVQEVPMTPGFHFKLPIVEDVIPMETRIQKMDLATAASSKDQQDVLAKITLNYYVMKGSTPYVYSTLGLDYSDRVIMSAIEESTKAATAKYTAAELITARPSVKNDITTNIKARLVPHNIGIDQVSITNFSFSPQYSQAIENKQIAEQKAEQATRDLQRIQIEAQQRVTQAQAEANATRLQGDANAYAIQATGRALRENPDVAKIKWIEKWNGELPFYTAGDAGNMMLLDASV